MDMPTIIRSARRKKDLSQREVATKLKVAPSAVAQWETGVTKPKIANRVDLSQLLSIPFSDLLPEFAAPGLEGDDQKRHQWLQLFQRLPEPIRESLLMQAAATAEAIEAASKQPPSKK